VTIADNDVATPQPGSVQLNAATYSGNENGGSVALTLTRTGGTDGAISVSVTTSGGSASAGADYTAPTSTVSWASGDGTPKVVNLVLLDDATVEGNETITVTVGNPMGGATVGAQSSATVNIVDDDVAPPPPPPPSSGGGSMGWWFLALLAGLRAARRR
jgi:hypothetical protein